MTVSQIRELMMERVVPESVLPQNITACLIDEDAAPPELDAFTFLNRLRSLGIGSADFLYLLKGCGAPAEAVEKIEQHPDMNLQALIVTLDGSGLTPRDYTRMLYTARQLWERTITMRLELDELNAQPAPEPEIRTAKQKKNTEETPEATPEKPLPRTARQKKKSEQEFREYAGVKPIGKRNSDEEEPEVYTAVQLNLPPEIDENDDSPAEEAEPQEQEIHEDDPHGRRSALIACAVGAAIVCAADIAVGMLGFSAPNSDSASLHFASDSTEIFTEIYSAYSNGLVGGENIQPASPQAQVFGNLLVTGDEQLGSFSAGNFIWSAEPGMIMVHNASDGTEKTEILPPDGAEFVRVEFTESGVTAVFTGDGFCGVTGADENGTLWTSTQCGKLTDIYVSGDTFRLGSVYTPGFTENFTISDELAYLPWTEYSGERTALLPGETAVTGTAQGCSYAMNAEYSANGEIKTRMAVLGDPLFSGAEFFSAALNSENQTLLVTLGSSSELTCCTTTKATAAAIGNGLIATAEETQDGATTVYIRDRDLKTISAFTANGAVASMKFDGNSLLLSNDDIVTLAAELSAPAEPKPLALTAADGTVNGEYALCHSVSSAGITLTLYHLEDGKAVQADLFSKTLTSAELDSFCFIGRNTTVVNGTECSGAAYTWFDGVSMVSEFAEMGMSRNIRTLYDDPDGFTAAAYTSDGLVLLCGSRKQ